MREDFEVPLDFSMRVSITPCTVHYCRRQSLFYSGGKIIFVQSVAEEIIQNRAVSSFLYSYASLAELPVVESRSVHD